MACKSKLVEAKVSFFTLENYPKLVYILSGIRIFFALFINTFINNY